MPRPPSSPESIRAKRVGAMLSVIHLGMFLISVWLSRQGEGWAGVFIWPLSLVVDFPVSALHALFFAPKMDELLRGLRGSNLVLSYALYSPYLIHGVFGTIWWYFLPSIYRRFRARIASKESAIT
jgi:hypothetical protein